MRHQLKQLASRLQVALSMIDPSDPKKALESRRKKMSAILRKLPREHAQLFARKEIIERRKEEQEKLQEESARELRERQLATQKLLEEQEQERLKEEKKKRDRLRMEREKEAIENEEIATIIREIEEKTGVKLDVPAGEKLDKKALRDKHVEILDKERQELQQKLLQLTRRMDYVERALREVERPKLLELYRLQQVTDEEAWNERKRAHLDAMRTEFETNKAKKALYSKMKEHMVRCWHGSW